MFGKKKNKKPEPDSFCSKCGSRNIGGGSWCGDWCYNCGAHYIFDEWVTDEELEREEKERQREEKRDKRGFIERILNFFGFKRIYYIEKSESDYSEFFPSFWKWQLGEYNTEQDALIACPRNEIEKDYCYFYSVKYKYRFLLN